MKILYGFSLNSKNYTPSFLGLSHEIPMKQFKFVVPGGLITSQSNFYLTSTSANIKHGQVKKTKSHSEGSLFKIGQQTAEPHQDN